MVRDNQGRVRNERGTSDDKTNRGKGKGDGIQAHVESCEHIIGLQITRQALVRVLVEDIVLLLTATPRTHLLLRKTHRTRFHTVRVGPTLSVHLSIIPHPLAHFQVQLQHLMRIAEIHEGVPQIPLGKRVNRQAQNGELLYASRPHP